MKKFLSMILALAAVLAALPAQAVSDYNSSASDAQIDQLSNYTANCAAWLVTPSSANLAACLSDETGSGGGFVRATGPTVTGLISDIVTAGLFAPTNGGGVRVSDTTTGHGWVVQVYSNAASAWRTVMTFLNGTSPSVTIANASDGTLTLTGDAVYLNNSGGVRLSDTTSGHGWVEQVYSNASSAWQTFGTYTNGAAPSVVYSAPADGTISMTGQTNSTFKAGTSSTAYSPNITICVVTTAVGNVGGGEDDLQTCLLKANSLSQTGRTVHIKAMGSLANNVNAKTVILYFGSAAILTNVGGTSLAQFWDVDAYVTRTGSSTQIYRSYFERNGTASVYVPDFEPGTASQTDSSDITIKLTGQGTSDNDITCNLLVVELVN